MYQAYAQFPGFPVAQHFNSSGHSISDVQVRGVALCSVTNVQRRQREMQLIFQIGTVQPKGPNINFSFIWIGTLYTSCVRDYACACFYHFYDVYDIAFTVQRFFLTLKKSHKAETFVFLKTFDTFRYFFAEYHLISCCPICSLRRPMRMPKREGEG